MTLLTTTQQAVTYDPATHKLVPNELVSMFCNALDNLGDMPISEAWAADIADRGHKLMEENNYFRNAPAAPSGWMPIESMPNMKLVDIWVKSHDNENFGRRGTDVCTVDGKWHGLNAPKAKYGEYASHWCPTPKAPIKD